MMPFTIIIPASGCKNLQLSVPKTNWARQKLTYQAAFDFNPLSHEIQGTESILLFKKKLERVP